MKKRTTQAVMLFMGVLLLLGTPVFARAEVSLTPEEQAYIAGKKVLKAVTIDGVAPIVYRGKNGEAEGISRLVLDEISALTGLAIEYELYGSVEEALKSEYDIFFATAKPYAPEGMLLSKPYLKSETILYINAALDTDDLYGKRFSAVRGGALPEGVNEKTVLYCDTREASLNAVESGEADYGYGNAYSVTFYTLHNGYKNIVTIPTAKEYREYCIGCSQGDELLLSILNKALASIDENHMQRLIMNAMVYADRKISFTMLMDAYGRELLSVAALIMSVLLFVIFSHMRVNRKLSIQNRRHERLSNLSNEYLYEYFHGAHSLELSEKCMKLFETPEALQASSSKLKELLLGVESDGYADNVTLELGEDASGVFKMVNACVYDDGGRLTSIIGKLIDVSAEAAEKERLLFKAQADGLTGLYNATTTKELITEALMHKAEGQMDAFFLMDYDDFKKINDTFGHLAGDQVLVHTAKSLRLTFRSSDVMGRVGGDEFVAYARNLPSSEFVRGKCVFLKSLIQAAPVDLPVSVSIGVALVTGETSYDKAFKMADDALYRAKAKGKGEAVVCGCGEEECCPPL